MQFFQHSRKGLRPKLKREVVRATVPEEASPGTEDGRPSREIQDPSVSMPVTIMLAGDCALLKGFIL